MTHAISLVYSISYVTSHSKKVKLLQPKILAACGAIWAVYYFLDAYDAIPLIYLFLTCGITLAGSNKEMLG